MGRGDEALAEVEAALALNETYRTAVDLKGLILADSGHLQAAVDFLNETDLKLERAKPASTHEAMFAAYLRGVLALLTGRAAQVGALLSDWPDLLRNFARAELLLAAADHLTGQSGTCGRRLAALAEEWSVEPVYRHLLAGHHLAAGRFDAVTEVVAAWPGGSAAEPDWRPLYLGTVAALGQGRLPTIPEGARQPPAHEDTVGGPDPAAWTFLRARRELMQDDPAACWQSCAGLDEAGLVTERVLQLQLRAAARLGTEAPAWQPVPAWPDSCLTELVQLAISSGNEQEAGRWVARRRQVHPEDLVGYWLDAAFWLEPVRSWIA
jgi:hypothetical protein